jgi:hypothetical protein
MSLLSSHDLVDDNYLITRIKEYCIPIGHMHPVAFFWHIEPFYIAVCMRMVGKPIELVVLTLTGGDDGYRAEAWITAQEEHRPEFELVVPR